MNQVTSTPDPAEVVVLLTLHFKPGTAEQVLASVIPSVQPTRAEAGNKEFRVFRVKGIEDKVVIFERWQSQAALDAHWQLPYTKEALALFDEHLVAPLAQTQDVAYLLEATTPVA